jgi:hypothetical protein
VNENEVEVPAAVNAVNAECAAARILVAHTNMSKQDASALVTLIVMASMYRTSAVLVGSM